MAHTPATKASELSVESAGDPRLGSRSFDCPYCGVYAQQDWFKGMVSNRVLEHVPVEAWSRRQNLLIAEILAGSDASLAHVVDEAERILVGDIHDGGYWIDNLSFSRCHVCKQLTIWRLGQPLYPSVRRYTRHPDLPEECHVDFEEACSVAKISPRAGAALLRASMEKLLFKLTGETNPSDAIARLVREGLSQRIQKAMDPVRVTGNRALHGYKIAEDAVGTADFEQLVQLHNLIVENQITQKRLEDEIFGALPLDDLARIERRNTKK